jgi:hypothetical protein
MMRVQLAFGSVIGGLALFGIPDTEYGLPAMTAFLTLTGMGRVSHQDISETRETR